MSKIVFTGASGTGKTVWAKHIESKFKIPFISLAGGALWDKYGIKTHSEVISRSINNPAWGLAYEMELMQLREKVYKENTTFVSDRSSICNLVYSIMQVGHVISKGQTEELMQKALELHDMVDLTIYFPYDPEIYDELDEKRVKNPYYQLATDGIWEKLIQEFFTAYSDTPLVGIKTIDRDERSEAIDEVFLNVLNIGISKTPRIITEL